MAGAAPVCARCGVAVPRKGNGEGFVIALCVLVTALFAATGYWVVLPRVRALIGGTATVAGRGSGKAERTTKLYLFKATDDAAIGPGIRRSAFSRAVTLINDRLEEQVPFSAGWNIRVNRLGKAGNLDGCGTLFRKDGEAMWYHRWGRIVEHPEGFPTACDGEVLPARADPEETVCGYVDATTMKWRSSLRFSQCGEFREGLAWVEVAPGTYRYVNERGEFAFAEQFSFVTWFTEGLARVKPMGSENFGFIDKTGKLVIPARFKVAGTFGDGLAAAAVQGEKQIGFIDKTGAFRIPATFDRVEAHFSEGRAFVSTGESFQMIDTTGRPLPVNPKLYGAEQFSNGVSVVNSGHGKLLLLGRDGRQLPTMPFTAVGPFHHGVAVAERDGKAMVIDGQGQVLILGDGESFGPYGGRYLQMYRQNATDLIDLTAKLQVRVEGRTVTRNRGQ